MYLYDMKHYCAQDIIELKSVSSFEGDKDVYFKKNESVRISDIGKHVLIASMDDEEKFLSVEAVDSHTQKILENIINIGMPKLAEVVSHEKNIVTLMVKRFNEERLLNYSIYITEEFLNKIRKKVQLKHINDPKKDIEKDTIFNSGAYSYTVIGIHTRAAEKQKYNDFVICGKTYYLNIKKRIDELGREYYFAYKITPKINTKEYKFFLAKGKFKYTDEKEIVKQETLVAMENLSDDTYIKIWDDYGELERKIIMDKAISLKALHYVNIELGTKCRFDFAEDNEEKLYKFKSEFSEGDILSLALINPFETQIDSEEFSQFLDKNKNSIINVKLANDIDVDSGCIYCDVEDERINIFKEEKSGYIFMSVQGDKKRLERRENARRKIENALCPMPNLVAILEGKSVTNPKIRHLVARSEAVNRDIFTDKKGNFRSPTLNQERAIEIALNTPDIALIQGPPGTGKTTVITAILKRLNEEADLTEGIFGRNLVTAFQHDAVQNAIDRIEILGLPAIKFGRKYSNIDDEYSDINSSIQNWINEKIAILNSKHLNIFEKKYVVEYDKVFNNYMYSNNTIDHTILILEKVKKILGIKLSSELLDKLNSQIRDLKYLTRGKTDPGIASLIRAVRRIPTSEIAFEDDGYFETEIAIRMLKQENNKGFFEEISRLEEMQKSKNYNFSEMKKIRKSLLVQILPKEKVFTDRFKREEIKILLIEIYDYLMEEIISDKDGEDLVVLEYIQALEENPLAVKNAILDYTSVNGATNQQVMRKEISDLKGGDIIYDNVLVDEAARSNPLDLFIPMSVAKDRIILVGDHRQLPHIVDDEIVRQLEANKAEDIKEEVSKKIKESMFEQLFIRLKKLEAIDGIQRTITLDKQFRMHPVLGKFIDDNFYSKYSESEHVGNGIEDPKVFSHQLPGIENKACIWYDVKLEKGKEKKGQSKSRKIEAVKIAEHLKEMLLSEEGKTYTYGIITFYREQVNVIYEELYKSGVFVKDESGNYIISSEYRNNDYSNREYIKIGTVDAFQGMEFDFVYLSMVRSNDEKVTNENMQKDMQKKYGFLMYENRLCVAMSRQKKALICVGDSDMLSGNHAEEAIAPLIEYYKLCKEDTYGKII